MSSSSSSAADFKVWEDGRDVAIERCILPMSSTSHKGSSGRIVVLGGSSRYTGAPYYAGMAALRTGSDLATIFTAQEATIPIKCYSPELMVQAVYEASVFDQYNNNNNDDGNVEVSIQSMVDSVTENLDRVHCLVIGPGLGRCPAVMEAVAKIVHVAKQQKVYMVLDADALFLLSLPQYRNLLQGYDRAVITPNVMEYKRLFVHNDDDDDDNDNNDDSDAERSNPLESVTIVQKGFVDIISVNNTTMYECHEEGGWKRAGGIGDVLSGAIGTLVAWHAIISNHPDYSSNNNNVSSVASSCYSTDLQLACWTACCLVKRATKRAFAKKKRAMSATDVLDELGPTMEEMTSSS